LELAGEAVAVGEDQHVRRLGRGGLGWGWRGRSLRVGDRGEGEEREEQGDVSTHDNFLRETNRMRLFGRFCGTFF
jgi:hypothetical protein